MSKNKILDSLFKHFLDGKTARVESEGLIIQGCENERVSLQYHSQWGLHCLGNLNDNAANVHSELASIFTAQRERLNFSLDTQEKIIDLLSESLPTISVNFGVISPWDVKSFSVTTDDQGELLSLSITYNKGSRVSISELDSLPL